MTLVKLYDIYWLSTYVQRKDGIVMQFKDGAKHIKMT